MPAIRTGEGHHDRNTSIDLAMYAAASSAEASALSKWLTIRVGAAVKSQRRIIQAIADAPQERKVMTGDEVSAAIRDFWERTLAKIDMTKIRIKRLDDERR